MKQTAVEFLEEKLKGDKIFSLDVIITKAKEMEKQQIIDAYSVGYITDFKLNSDYTTQTPQQYYNETFKSE